MKIVSSRILASACLAALMLAAGSAAPGFAAEKKSAASGDAKEFIYKKTPQGELKIYVHYPPAWKSSDQRPAIVFFFGGAWKHGSPTQFLNQAEYLATRGMVTARADYRIQSRDKTTPDKCVEDAKSALRWLRGHAKELGVDPARIVAAGGSAGGHLAAATALVPGFNDPGDDASVSCQPSALVLYNPALNFPDHEVKNAAGKNIGPDFWPTPFMAKAALPTVIFFGTGDRMLPQGREYCAKARELGARAEVLTAADQPHGFFNRSPWKELTLVETDRFLATLGYLKGEPTLKLPDDTKAVLQRQK